MRSGNHQVRIKYTDVPETSFRTRYGQLKYLGTPSGLNGVLECFQTLINDVLRPYLDRSVAVYVGDILVYSKSKHEHFEHPLKVPKKLRDIKLYNRLSKCEFLRSQIQYLEHENTEGGTQVDESRIMSRQDCEPP